VRGNCPYTTHCLPCDDPGIYKACSLHEGVHCSYENNICADVNAQHTPPTSERSRNEYSSDLAALIKNELDAYNTSIGELKRILEAGECCYHSCSNGCGLY
jgi:hypothetical protein